MKNYIAIHSSKLLNFYFYFVASTDFYYTISTQNSVQ